MKHSKELAATAYHEAGHVAAHLKFEIPFKYATIIPDPKRDSLGHVQRNKWQKKLVEKLDYGGILTPSEEIRMKKEMITFVAAAVAEAKYLKKKKIPPGWYGDREQCVDLMLRVLDCGEKVAAAYFNYIVEETKELIDNPLLWDFIKELATQLLEQKTLSYKKCQEIFKKLIYNL